MGTDFAQLEIAPANYVRLRAARSPCEKDERGESSMEAEPQHGQPPRESGRGGESMLGMRISTS